MFSIVKQLNQTLVSGIKEAAQDGKLTQAEKQQLKMLAVNKLRSFLGVEGLKSLIGILGNDNVVEDFLESKVESALFDTKNPPKES